MCSWREEHAKPFYCELHGLPLPGPMGSIHSQWGTLYLQFRWSLPHVDVGNAEVSVQIQFSIQIFESCKVTMHQSAPLVHGSCLALKMQQCLWEVGVVNQMNEFPVQFLTGLSVSKGS